ncbi:ABC transporter permease [Shewanella sp. 0m-8]
MSAAKGFSFTFIFTIAITLGGLIAAFSLHQTIVLKPLPYPESNQLFHIQQSIIKGDKVNSGAQIEGAQLAIHEHSKLNAVPIFQDKRRLLNHPQEPSIITLYTTGQYFNFLAPKFALGHGLDRNDTFTEAKAEAVISYKTWQELFSQRNDILGQSVKIEDQFYRIVGVLAAEQTKTPKPFAVFGDTQVIIPFAFSGLNKTEWGNASRSFSSLLKLNPSQSVDDVETELSQIISRFMENSEAKGVYGDIQFKALLTPLAKAVKGDQDKVTWMILAGAGMLLLIAFANISNLYLSHTEANKYSLAVHACLGASPNNLFIKLLVESSVLISIALIFSLLTAAWLFRLIQTFAADSFARLDELALDSITLLFSFVVSLVLAMLLAFISSRKIDYLSLKEHISSSGKGISQQANQRTRQILTGSQVTFASLILLASSMILGQALTTINKPLGFNSDNIISVQMYTPKGVTEDEQISLLSLAKQHFLELDSVTMVSKNTMPPIRKGDFGLRLADENSQNQITVGFNSVDENYFSILEQDILFGRNFSKAEIEDASNVALISEALAKERFGDSNAIGKRIFTMAGDAYEVVGVAADHFNAHTHASYLAKQVYFPIGTFRLNLLLKFKDGSNITQQQAIAELKQIDPRLVMGDFIVISERAKQQVAQHRIAAYFTLGMSLLALIIAATGIYGVMNYSGQLRKFELGVRMAIGATPRNLTIMMLTQGLAPVLFGFVLSIAIALVGYLVLGKKLAEFSSPNWDSLMVASAVLLLVALISAYKPLHSLLKNNPVEALRNQ